MSAKIHRVLEASGDLFKQALCLACKDDFVAVVSAADLISTYAEALLQLTKSWKHRGLACRYKRIINPFLHTHTHTHTHSLSLSLSLLAL